MRWHSINATVTQSRQEPHPTRRALCHHPEQGSCSRTDPGIRVPQLGPAGSRVDRPVECDRERLRAEVGLLGQVVINDVNTFADLAGADSIR
jgi:hypothetical protein